MGISFRRVGANLAAEVEGIDLAAPLPDADRDAIRDGLAEHQLLIFRDQVITSDRLMEFGRSFGELSVHPFAPHVEDTPALIRFENDAETPPFGTDVWHSDETFRAAPPMATALCAKVVPEVGGDTVFASMSAAYDGLSERMRSLIDGLQAVHDIKPFKAIFEDTPEDREELRKFEAIYPPMTHPVVRVHPATGRKALYVDRLMTMRIDGLPEDESDAILDEMFDIAEREEFVYEHAWTPGDLLVWDNLCSSHARTDFPADQRRLLRRCQIAGEARPAG